MAAQHDSAQPCPVCGAPNNALAFRCAACGAFVRDRVPALNLFSTFFGLVDAPRDTFLRIARSEQKNYVFTLFGASGPVFLALAAVAANAGDGGWNFGLTFLALFIAGPVLGIGMWSGVTWLLGRLLPAAQLPARRRFRTVSPLLAFALFPVTLASMVLLPIQCGVFGESLFSAALPAWELKPEVFWTLAGLDALFFAWSGVLLVRSFSALGITPARSAAAVLPLLAGVAALVFFCGKLLSGVVQ